MPGLKLSFRIVLIPILTGIICNGVIRHLSPWNKAFTVMDKKSMCGGKGGREAERSGWEFGC